MSCASSIHSATINGRLRLTVMMAVTGLLAVACSGTTTPEADAGREGSPGAESTPVESPTTASTSAVESQEPISVAFLAASSQNAFNAAVYEGIQAEAQEYENVETQMFDGEFDAGIQFNQVQDVVATGQYDGIIIVPQDTVGIAAALESAIEAGLAVVTTQFPVGPDLTTLEPQIEGLTATVAAPPAEGSRLMAQEVVEFCADLDPCNVVIMVGQLQFPFDNVRYEAWLDVLEEHDNIEVVATGEGNYNRDTALNAMQDILQANQDIDAVLSGADQHLFGIEIALEEAGYDVEEMYMIGLGGAVDAITKIREGVWDATKVDFPRTGGALALEQVVKDLRGGDVQQIINMDEVGPVPAILTSENIDEYPDFTGQFEG